MAPRKIRIDAASVCQLRCPGCLTGRQELPRVVGSGLLKVEDFRALLDKHPEVREVELSNWGEVLLHPDLADLLRVAHERNVAITFNNGVNLNTASDEALDAIVKYGVRAMVVSIDGATQEAYVKYRVRGNIADVIANIQKLNELKRQYDTSFPVMTWKMILFAHNQHEIADARRQALGLGMSFRTEINANGDFDGLPDEEAAREDSGLSVVTYGEHVEATGSTLVKKYCHQLWNEPQVNWDGKILGCCMNTWSDFGGNAFVDGLETERLDYAKKMLQGRAPERDDIPCTTCSEYVAMKKKNNWIRDREVMLNRARKRVARVTTSLLGARVLQPFGNRLQSWASTRGR